jgi:putative addiction module killer protein
LGLTVSESVQRAPRFENILPELKTVLPNADFVIEGYVDPT